MTILLTIFIVLAGIYYITGFFNNVKMFKKNFIENRKGKNKR